MTRKEIFAHYAIGSGLTAGIVSLFLLPQPQDRILVLLLLQVLFLFTLRLYKHRMAIVSFVVVLLASAITSLGPGLLPQKIINITVFLFTGYLTYFFFKSIYDEVHGNTTFVREEEKHIEFQKARFTKAETHLSSLKEQFRIWQQLSGFINKSSGLNRFDEIASFFTGQTARLFPGSVCAFCLLDKDAADSGFRIKNASEPSLPAGAPSPDNLDELVRDNRIPVLIENLKQEITHRVEQRSDFRFASAMAVPVAINEKLRGTLKCYHPEPGQFHTADLRALQYLADMQGVQLLNSLLYQETERLARIDGITGLYVQYFLMEKIREEIARARNQDSFFSLVIIDIDNFKRFNDDYGHLAGDFVLVHTADLIRACIRTVDFPARYGGDEFFLVLPETDTAGAARLAERIRLRLFESSAELEFNGVALDRRVTISIGVSSYKSDYGNAASFIAMVDALMYKAKQKGKNCVVAEGSDV